MKYLKQQLMIELWNELTSEASGPRSAGRQRDILLPRPIASSLVIAAFSPPLKERKTRTLLRWLWFNFRHFFLFFYKANIWETIVFIEELFLEAPLSLLFVALELFFFNELYAFLSANTDLQDKKCFGKSSRLILSEWLSSLTLDKYNLKNNNI